MGLRMFSFSVDNQLINMKGNRMMSVDFFMTSGLDSMII